MRALLLVAIVTAASLLARAQDAAPLFAATLTDLDGQPRALAQWQGRPLIVNFWARWCGPCRSEIPELARLGRQYREQGLEVIGIGIEDKLEPVRDFARAYEMDYPVLIGREQGLALMRQLGNAKLGLPFTVALDRRGQIVAVKLGAISPAELSAAAQAALKPR
ncbi:MAG: TlpA family protein disulfide reductase [Rhodocyclaceae bacterium]|nr:TlpA family protein disulfide reductase [Rhodocyclaceae bacterium]